MDRATSAVRWWRMPHLGRNPLVRTCDRVESALLTVVVLVVLLAVPVAGMLGSETYAQQRQEAQTQAATRHSATATLLEDAPDNAATGRSSTAGGTANVEAAWTLPNGTPATGIVVAKRGSEAGSEVEIWLDYNGSVVSAPLGSDVVVANAITIAVFAWLAVAAVSALACYLARMAFDRARYARWARDWERARNDWSRS
jgi:hypothetical protein